jgi:hypothetical protein
MNRTRALAVSCLALIIAATIVASSLAGQLRTEGTVLNLQMRHTEAKVTIIDETPRMTKSRPSESPGDSAVGQGTIRDEKGVRVGTVHNDFVVTTGRTPGTTEQVTSTFVLQQGQIATQGVIDQVGASEMLAVIGGTGAYEGASGTVEITGDEKAVRFAIRLK